MWALNRRCKDQLNDNQNVNIEQLIITLRAEVVYEKKARNIHS